MSQRDCSSCKKKYDIASFEENGRNFKMCLKCREKSRRKDLARRNDPKRIEYNKNKSKEKKYYQTYRDKKREEDNDAFVEHNTHRQRITHSFRVSALRHTAKGLTTVAQIPDETSICITEPYDHIDAIKYIKCSSIPKPYETVLE
jgi:Zn ribbon nucleic-acid-binding protein